MKFQEKSYSCGPAAIRAALYILLGKVINESYIRKLAGTTVKDGTDERGLFKALKHYKCRRTENIHTNSNQAWNSVKRGLRNGNPSVLCVSGWEHWVAAIGMIGDKILIFDPQRFKSKQKRYSGLKAVSLDDIVNNWSYKEEDGNYYYYSFTVKNR